MKKLKIIYAEGCFDELAAEMTQDEIDALTSEIEELVESGDLFEYSEELTEEESQMIMERLNRIEKNTRQ